MGAPSSVDPVAFRLGWSRIFTRSTDWVGSKDMVTVPAMVLLAGFTLMAMS